jgi:hypothetical protein
MGYFSRGTKVMLVQKKGKWAKVKTLKAIFTTCPPPT